MGLDQFAYIAKRKNTSYDDSSRQEIAYWRKHPNLQDWMERLWLEKIGVSKFNTTQFEEDIYPPHAFNGVEVELTWEDVDRLEKEIKSGFVARLGVPRLSFGVSSDDYYREQDLRFCTDAKADLFLGRRVFYNSSW
jgi:hypothetical protein